MLSDISKRASETMRSITANIGTMVADEDDDRAFFARNVVQCVSLAVGGRKPKLRRRRIKNDLGSCCRHIAPPCAQIYADDGLPGYSFQSLLASRVVLAIRQPFPVDP